MRAAIMPSILTVVIPWQWYRRAHTHAHVTHAPGHHADFHGGCSHRYRSRLRGERAPDLPSDTYACRLFSLQEA